MATGLFVVELLLASVPINEGLVGMAMLHVAMVTGGGSNIPNQFLSVSVITGGTNENVSNNVKIFLFSRNHITLTCIIYNKIHLKLIDTCQTKWACFT